MCVGTYFSSAHLKSPKISDVRLNHQSNYTFHFVESCHDSAKFKQV